LFDAVFDLPLNQELAFYNRIETMDILIC